MRKTGWEEPTTGPDWIDVEMLMRAIQALHSAHVALVASPRGIGSSGGLEVTASCIFDVLPGSSIPTATQVSKLWPCSTHKTLAAHSFALLHELDYAIGKIYENEALWK